MRISNRVRLYENQAKLRSALKGFSNRTKQTLNSYFIDFQNIITYCVDILCCKYLVFYRYKTLQSFNHVMFSKDL